MKILCLVYPMRVFIDRDDYNRNRKTKQTHHTLFKITADFNYLLFNNLISKRMMRQKHKSTKAEQTRVKETSLRNHRSFVWETVT